MKHYPQIIAGVVIYNDKNQVFLGKSKNWKNKWTIPGGSVDFGEKLESAAIREIKEETNIDIENIEFINIGEMIASSDDINKSRHLVFVNYKAKFIDSDIMLNDEFDKYGWFDLSDLNKIELLPSVKKLIDVFYE